MALTRALATFRAKVLDVGSGSGYLCACFGLMVGEKGKVVGIDRLPHLVDWGIANIKKDKPDLLEKGAPFYLIHVL